MMQTRAAKAAATRGLRVTLRSSNSRAIKQLTGSKAGGHGGASAGNIALHPRLLVQRILP